MSLNELLAGVDKNPPNIRWLRPQINRILNRDPFTRIDGELEAYYLEVNPGADDGTSGIYEIAPPIEAYSTVVDLFSARQVTNGPVVFLTDERPKSLLTDIANPPLAAAVSAFMTEPGVYVYSQLRDVPISFDATGTQPARIISEFSSGHFEAIYASGGRRLWKPPTKLIDAAALIFDEFTGINYCHWLLDWLPRFGLLEEAGFPLDRATVVLTRPPAAFQRETLDMLGVSQERRITLSTRANHGLEFLQASQLMGTSTTSRGYRHALHGGSLWAAEYLRRKFITKAESQCCTRIILDRRDTRRLIFDEQTSEALGRAGFRTVLAEELTFRQQVELFRGAEAIIAAHGAGLSNLVFCEPRASVLEVFPQDYSTPAYWVTANTVGMTYSCAVALSAERKEGSHIRDADLICSAGFVLPWLDTLGRR